MANIHKMLSRIKISPYLCKGQLSVSRDLDHYRKKPVKGW